MAWEQVVFLFFVYSFVGWMFESTVVSVSQRKITNRGFLFGPICPIYGTAAMLMVLALQKWTDNLVAVYFVGMFVATAVELVTGWGMEKIFKARWWDYAQHKFNFKGFICLRSSLVWGVMAILLMRFVHPLMESLYERVAAWGIYPIVFVLLGLFAVDVAMTLHSVIGMDKWAEALHMLQMKREDRAQKTSGESLRARLQLPKGQPLRDRWRMRMLNAYPRMRSLRRPRAIEDARRSIEQAKKEIRDWNENKRRAKEKK